jgi:fatty-acyl-CoA synthase
VGVTQPLDDLVTAARRRSLRTLPSAPFMHGAAHWNALSAWATGGTVVVQDDPTRFDPADVLATCARTGVTALQVVGDPFARPLLEELARTDHDLSALRFLLSGGAVLSAPVKARLTAALPGLTIVDVLGSSETGRQAVTKGEGAFVPERTAVVLSDDLARRLAPGDPEAGWLAQVGRVPMGYLGDEARTRATFPVLDGVRFAVSGDKVRLLADGRLDFLGRESVTINTGGEKVFAEEVEQALTSHPAVRDAVVVGRPSERWGQEVVAVFSLVDGASRPPDAELRDHCRTSLAGYKLPKAFVTVPTVRRSPAGKADYAWARDQASVNSSSVNSSVV